jgi:hypothetical protein
LISLSSSGSGNTTFSSSILGIPISLGRGPSAQKKDEAEETSPPMAYEDGDMWQTPRLAFRAASWREIEGRVDTSEMDITTLRLCFLSDLLYYDEC